MAHLQDISAALCKPPRKLAPMTTAEFEFLLGDLFGAAANNYMNVYDYTCILHELVYHYSMMLLYYIMIVFDCDIATCLYYYMIQL